MKKTKENSGRLECYEGGVEGLFRHYRAARMLALCLMLPLATGAMVAGNGDWALVLVLLMLVCGRTCASRITELAVYASDGSLADKSARVRALLLEDVRHHLVALALVLLAAASLLVWQKSAGASSEALRFKAAVLFCYAFLSCSFLAFQFSLAHAAARQGVNPIAIATLICQLAAIYFSFHDLGEATRLSMAILPCLLLPLLFLRWLASAPRRDELFDNAYQSVAMSWSWAVTSYFFILRLPNFKDKDYDYVGLLHPDPLTMVLLAGLPLLAYVLAFNWAMALMIREKIRRGLFITDPAAFVSQRISWPFKDRSPAWRGKSERRLVARISKPLLGPARHWKKVRRVTRWGERPWTVGLLSSLVTAYFLFGQAASV